MRDVGNFLGNSLIKIHVGSCQKEGESLSESSDRSAYKARCAIAQKLFVSVSEVEEGDGIL